VIRKQKLIRGFTFKNGIVKHIVYGDTILRLEPSARRPLKSEGQQRPIQDNRPYVSVQGKNTLGGVPVLHGLGQVQVFGRNFETGPNNPIEIRVDNRIVEQGVVADQRGHFRATVRVDVEIGWHEIQVLQRLTTGKTLRDSKTFVVRSVDK
jgi:hypothetical protein